LYVHRVTVRGSRKLLVTASINMRLFLLATSAATTLLIEADKLREGGEANGRALAYLGHKYLGNGFGALYDVSTILILAFAGASAMAGLLNLIPRYLPRFAMAPEWARAARPLVLVFITGAGADHIRCLCGNDIGMEHPAASALNDFEVRVLEHLSKRQKRMPTANDW
jgi:hypothetical protein